MKEQVILTLAALVFVYAALLLGWGYYKKWIGIK